jgi:hypothetical protein
MHFQFTNLEMIVAAVVLVVVVFIAVAIYLQRRKSKTAKFRGRFGSEYDRAVLEHGSPRKAETKLAERETRVGAMKIRELDNTERERFVAEWQTVQSRFVDHPSAAVTEADGLIVALLEARGYPKGNFEQRAADVSVTYPRVMANFRLANAIAIRPGQTEANTEELRTAMIKYRAIFDELVAPLSLQERATAA